MVLTRQLAEKLKNLGYIDEEIEVLFLPDPTEPILPDLASIFDSFDSEDFGNNLLNFNNLQNIMAQPATAERIKIPDYSGTENEDYDEWETYVRRAAASAEWADDYLLRHIPLHLKGPANLAYLELQDNEKDTVEHLYTALAQRLTSPKHREIAKSQLATLRQQPTQSVRQFGSEVHRLIHKAYGISPANTDLREMLALSTFKIGLSPRYRSVLHLHQPNTLKTHCSMYFCLRLTKKQWHLTPPLFKTEHIHTRRKQSRMT